MACEKCFGQDFPGCKNCQPENHTQPVAYLDDRGNIIVVGFDAWNRASFVDSNRAIPDSWKELKPNV